jgi:Putative peptidoglycan binding domain/YMGG-like Gly-zipper
MNSPNLVRVASAFALASLVGSCATWESMDRQEKGTAIGATGGAVVGAAVGGPVGAAVGAGVGGYTGHYESDKLPASVDSTSATSVTYGSPVVRSAQQALNDKGYSVGTVDGMMGPNTESAVRQFQQLRGLPQTGTLDSATLAALGVSQQSRSGPATQ